MECIRLSRRTPLTLPTTVCFPPFLYPLSRARMLTRARTRIHNRPVLPFISLFLSPLALHIFLPQLMLAWWHWMHSCT